MIVPPSRLVRLAGCDKPDCKVCTKEIALQAREISANDEDLAPPANRGDTRSPPDGAVGDRRDFGQQQLPLTTDTP